jgi:hypothetical protein
VVKETLKPGLMKGPNAGLLCVDELPKKIRPNTWNNVPIPVTDAFNEIITVF